MGPWGSRGHVSSCCCSPRHLLLLLAASMFLPNARSLLSPDGLSCLCDFNTTISCVWDSGPHANITAATPCTLQAHKENSRKPRKMSCVLIPLDLANPDVRGCALVSPTVQLFSTRDRWTISVACESVMLSLAQPSYNPAQHIKLKPPMRPEVNLTTVSLLREEPKNFQINECVVQLQWRQENQPWEDVFVVNHSGIFDQPHKVELWELEQGRRYQARTRIQPKELRYRSEWSDWSPVVTWVLPITPKELPESPGVLMVIAITGLAVVLCLGIIVCKMDTWVYMVKKITGPPLPNPGEYLRPDGKSQVWLKTGFTCESHCTVMRVDVISSVEVTSRWSAPPENQGPLMTPCRFSNPTYSPAHYPPPSQGNLEPCKADSPYGPVVSGGAVASAGEPEEEEEEEEEDRGGRAQWGVDLLYSISGANAGPTDKGPAMAVCLGYQQLGNVGGQSSSEPRRPGGHPGVGCGEEEKQDSLDGGCSDEGDGRLSQTDIESQESSESLEEDVEGPQIETSLSDVVARRAILGQGSLEDYEMVRLLEGQQHRSQSLDSGVGSGGGEQFSQDSLEDVDSPHGTETHFTRSSFIQTPSIFPEQGTSSPFSFRVQDGDASMMNISTMLPSGGGYMPLKTQN